MNKDRRKSLEKIIDRLEDVRTTLEDIKTDLEDIKIDEEDAYDNLPDSLKECDRGYDMQSYIDSLDSACNIDTDDAIDEIIGYIEECL